MTTQTIMKLIQPLLLPVLLALSAFFPATAQAQTPAFTYQGVLTQSGVPANDTNDFEFKLYNLSAAGAQHGGTVMLDDVGVTNGLFTVTLDFGASVFDGNPRWLDISVRPGASEGGYTNLAPRQPVTSTPYAMRAGSVSGVIGSNGIAGSYGNAVFFSNTGNNFSGSGAGLTGLNADELLAGTVPSAALDNAWRIGGNAGTTPGTHFLGTTDHRALEIRVNGLRALRIEPTAGSPNLIVGSFSSVATNSIGASVLSGNLNTIGTGSPYAIIAGGSQNIIAPGAFGATISGGQFNVVTTNGGHGVIAGGQQNRVDAGGGIIGGGNGNSVEPAAYDSVVAGGGQNLIKSNSVAAVVSGGYRNQIGTNAPYTSIAGGYQNRIDANNSSAVVGGGYLCIIGTNSVGAVIDGGAFNTIAATATYSVIGGGSSHHIGTGADHSTIAGGYNNSVGTNASAATIGGGRFNYATGDAHDATIPGGRNNLVAGAYALAAGRQAKALHEGSFVWADAIAADFTSSGSNQFLIRASGGVAIGTNDPAGAALRVAGMVKAESFMGMGALLMLGTSDLQPVEFKVNNERALRLEYPTAGSVPNFIGGYSGNSVEAGTEGAVIVGGGAAGFTNFIGGSANHSTVGGGSGNNIGNGAFGAVVAGGQFNTITTNGGHGVISGGQSHRVNAGGGAIGGGNSNAIERAVFDSVISGGYRNRIDTNAVNSVIGGGVLNKVGVGAAYAVIAGGRDNEIGPNASHAFAAGRRAKANHQGDFVWADSQDADFASTGTNQFLIRASGGVGINSSNPGSSALAVDGAVTFNSSSQTPLAISGANSGGSWVNLINTSSGGRNWSFISTGSGNGEGAGNLLFRDTTANAVRMSVLTNGNVGIGTTTPTNKLHVIGNVSATSFVTTSDRNAKKNLAPVNALIILEKVAALPISRWNFKDQDDGEHVGPMAQDFQSAFGLGNTDTGIATVDADGVALAAIQGLNEKVEVRSQKTEVSIQELRAENAELKTRLVKLETLLMDKMNGGGQ